MLYGGEDRVSSGGTYKRALTRLLLLHKKCKDTFVSLHWYVKERKRQDCCSANRPNIGYATHCISQYEYILRWLIDKIYKYIKMFRSFVLQSHFVNLSLHLPVRVAVCVVLVFSVRISVFKLMGQISLFTWNLCEIMYDTNFGKLNCKVKLMLEFKEYLDIW